MNIEELLMVIHNMCALMRRKPSDEMRQMMITIIKLAAEEIEELRKGE